MHVRPGCNACGPVLSEQAGAWHAADLCFSLLGEGEPSTFVLQPGSCSVGQAGLELMMRLQDTHFSAGGNHSHKSVVF